MGVLVIPEAIITRMVEGFLDFLRNEIKNSTTESETFLYLLLKGESDSQFDYYDNAKNIFSRKPDDERRVQFRQTLDRSRLQLPTITLLIDEETLHKRQSVGQGEGDYGSITTQEGKLKAIYSKRYNGKCHLLITSDNPAEVMVIEAVMKAGLNSVFMSFDDSCLQGLRIERGGLQMGSEAINAAHVGLEISYFYDLKTPYLSANEILDSITFNGKPY
jgi:hypothetical protein